MVFKGFTVVRMPFSQKLIFPLLFGIYLLIGVLVHADYGVSWDEPISRMNGLVNLKYVEQVVSSSPLPDDLREIPDLATWNDRDYGVAFELPLVAIERAFHAQGDEIYALRHLITFLFCSLGVVAVYGTARFVYSDERMGLIAAAMMVLSPRLFAESFYNSKDLVFVAAIAIATYTLTRIAESPRARWVVLHGAATAFAIDVRIMGVMMVAATAGLLVVRMLKREISIRRGSLAVLGYFAVTGFVVVAMFPFLWADPVGHFLEALQHMARFRWHGSVLYRGQITLGTDIPWHYLLVWIAITTPIAFSLFMMAGLARGIGVLARNRWTIWRDSVERSELTYLALLALPIVAVVAFHSVVYDGWRHVYFVYPAFVLVATAGFRAVCAWFADRRIAILTIRACLFFSLAASASWMIAAHPLQNVYFNVLAGAERTARFDVDYWGMSNRGALEYVRDHESTGRVSVKAIGLTAIDRALLMMPAVDRTRFSLGAPDSKPEFILTNYRLLGLCDATCDLSDYRPYYERRVDGEPVVSVFKIRSMDMVRDVTTTDRVYSAQVIRGLSYGFGEAHDVGGQVYVDLLIRNTGADAIAARSSIGRPIRVSWRFDDVHGVPVEGWNNRLDLPRDIPSNGQIVVAIPIDTAAAIDGGTLEASLVQEGEFWAHDIGIPPASMPWRSRDKLP